MDIRDAVTSDAESASQVLRRSIAELCVVDHHDDPAILRRWLENKTPAIFLTWLAQLDHSLLIAVERDTILAVGGVHHAGIITLNYVSPDARFRNISRSMIGALEDRAADKGNERLLLDSTLTAYRFYRATGYVDRGPPDRKFDMIVYPMIKFLAPHHS